MIVVEEEIKMKKIIAIILCVVLSIALIAGCASSAAGFGFSADSPASASDEVRLRTAANETMAMAPAMPESAPMPDAEFEAVEEFISFDDDAMWSYSVAEQEAAGGIAPISAPVPDEAMAEKIIYTVFANIETKEFDATIAGVQALLTRYNAFIENSSISGVNYASQFHGWSDLRTANFTIRVPNQHLNVMTGRLDDLGNVVHQSSTATNITSQFIDTQSRLNSLTVQEERLLTMLGQAEDVPDLIMIEERISDVRFQIESLTTTINTWQSQVDFSTVTLTIWEVEQFTELQETQYTYWQQIANGFSATMRGIGRFFMNVFMWIIVAAPVIIIILVIVAVALLIIRAKVRKFKRNQNAKLQNAAQNNAQNATQNVLPNTQAPEQAKPEAKE